MDYHHFPTPMREDAARSRYHMVAAPQPSEGLSSALRVAFDAPVPEGVPADLDRLLRQLN